MAPSEIFAGCMVGNAVAIRRHHGFPGATSKAIAWPQGHSKRKKQVKKNIE